MWGDCWYTYIMRETKEGVNMFSPSNTDTDLVVDLIDLPKGTDLIDREDTDDSIIVYFSTDDTWETVISFTVKEDGYGDLYVAAGPVRVSFFRGEWREDL
jgi:hypothetical protein